MNLALAVDLGTTTLEWALLPLSPLLPLPDGDPLSHALWRGSSPNPQAGLEGAGSDVLSRLAFAQSPEGRAALHKLTAEALADLVRAAGSVPVCQDTSSDSKLEHDQANIVAICLAANPAMTALALDFDSAGLAAAPYSLPDRGGRWVAMPGLPKMPPIWIPPQLSPFVGGDLAAGYAALALNPAAPPPAFPFVLADMGTNGEFLLALAPDKALAASVALGPALEGAGLRMGSAAKPGAASGFALRPEGLTALVLREGQQSPSPAMPGEQLCGITGTGYLSLLRLLLHSALIDRHGHFTKGSVPVWREPSSGIKLEHCLGESYLELPHSLRLYASDVEELLKVKAAFSLGLRRLLAAGRTATRDLSGVWLAGSLGRHTDKEALEALGFFPSGFLPRLHAAGNSSLAGAALALRHPPAREALKDWAAQVSTVNLAADPGFTRAFAAHMRFAW